MQRRTIKKTPRGELSKPRVREALHSVHVTPKAGRWRVVTLAPQRVEETFPRQSDAMEFAQTIARKNRRRRKIVVHQD